MLVVLAGCTSSAQQAPPLAPLIAALEGESREVQIAAIGALSRMGPAAKEAVEPLSKLVLSSRSEVSQPAAAALSRIDTHALVALLMPRLESPDEKVKAQAVKALEYVGPGAAPFAPALTVVVRTAEEPWTRAAAANGLGQMGALAADAVPTLIEGLRHRTEFVRRYCAKGLGNIGAKAVSAIPALQEAAAQEGDPRFAEWAREALEKIRKASAGSAKSDG
jgi:HEAT repeat protein